MESIFSVTGLALLTIFAITANAGPQYPFPVAKGGTGIKTCASGSVVYSNGTVLVCSTGNLSINTSTGVLTFQGGTTATYATTSPSVNRLQFSTAIQVGGTTAPLLSKMSANSLYIGDATSGAGLPAVVSSAPGSNSLMIVRGCFTFNGSTWLQTAGEGFGSTSSGSSGGFVVGFSASFGDTPAVSLTYGASSGFKPYLAALAFNSIQVATGGGSNTNDYVCVIAIGQRATGT